MKLQLKETASSEPKEWFQLCIEDIPTNAYWPTQGVVDYVIGDLRTMYGLDVEAEAYKQIYETFIKEWPMFAETPGQTRLQIVFAVRDINKRCGEKFRELLLEKDSAVTYHEKRPPEKPIGSYDPKPFNNL